MIRTFLTNENTLAAIDRAIYEKRIHTNSLEYFDFLQDCEVNGKTIFTFDSQQMSRNKIEVGQDIRWFHNGENTNKNFKILKIIQGKINGCEGFTEFICIVKRIH